MICPVFRAAVIIGLAYQNVPGIHNIEDLDEVGAQSIEQCIEGRCGWWDEHTKRCSISKIKTEASLHSEAPSPEKIIHMRESLGWNTRKLAREIGVSDRTVREWESGRDMHPHPKSRKRLWQLIEELENSQSHKKAR